MPTARTPSVRLHGGWPGFSGVIISCVSTCDLPWIIGVKSFHVIFHSHFESFHQSPQNPPWCFSHIFDPHLVINHCPARSFEVAGIAKSHLSPFLGVFNHRPPQNAQLRRWKIHPPKHFKWGFFCVFTYMQTKKTPQFCWDLYYPTSMECPTGPTGHRLFAHFPIHICWLQQLIWWISHFFMTGF